MTKVYRCKPPDSLVRDVTIEGLPKKARVEDLARLAKRQQRQLADLRDDHAAIKTAQRRSRCSK